MWRLNSSSPLKVISSNRFGELLQERTECCCQPGSSSGAVGLELTSRGNYFCQIFVMEIVYLQHVLKP